MSAAKNPIGTRRQALLLGALGIVLLFAVVRWRSSQPSTPTPTPATSARGVADGEGGGSPRAPAGRRGAAAPVTADEVPLLSPGDLQPRTRQASVITDRDLFDLREPTQRPAPTPAPAPPPPPAPGEQQFIGPLPPPSPTATPAPPAIPFKFIGSFGPKDRPIAVLLGGDRLVNARAGDVVFDKFILRKVGYESIDVGFVGFAAHESRRLGIEK